MTHHAFDTTSAPTRHVWLAWLIFAVIWFGTIGHNVLIHPDEGRYASISLGMLQSGDWLSPRLNGLLYFEKPALPYWLGALSFQWFGVNEFAARLWPALAGFLSIALVGFTAGRLWGREAGHLSAMIMGGSSWVMLNSHFLNLDTGLTAFLTLSLCAFLLSQQEDAGQTTRRGWMWLCWAGMAGATLCKGLIGIAIPGAVLVLYSLLSRQFTLWRRLHLITGLIILLLLTAPWLVLVSMKNPDFAHFFFIHEHVQRFLTTEHRRTGPVWYFVPYLLVGFMPWITLLPAVLAQGLRREGRCLVQPERLLLIWALFVFVFFSVSGSKLPSYILPMFPALALLAGRALADQRPAMLFKHMIVPVCLWIALLVASFLVRRWVSADTPLAVLQSLAHHVQLAAVVFLVGAACAWRFLALERLTAAVIMLSLASLAALSLVEVGYNAYAQLKSSKEIVQTLHPTADTEVFSVRTYDQTLPFYLRRDVVLVDYVDEFELGEHIEPSHWIPTLDGFVARWQAAPRALAFLSEDTYQQLKAQGLPMRIAYQDPRRLVVAKP
ncbi:glycosyltransferase family 39 protein [Paludibacterium sp.]|uniref:ArnT family glycosyltransferase n=1 Tax=Paludibacterium sp. TaxID=1917523 RepID=UPI0025D83B47|nr:glycosyltransferase family 39 protein [Paludibacterium sp.]MBV8649218.1 glycosyltransferase family 39 protein [Paludibacterium sp.]